MIKDEKKFYKIIALVFLIGSTYSIVQSAIKQEYDMIIVGAVIFVFSLIGLIFLKNHEKAVTQKAHKNLEKIKENANIVKGKYLGIFKKSKYDYEKGNYNNNSYLICSWHNPQDNKFYVFSSSLYYNLHKNIKDKIEKIGLNEFDIYIDKDDMKKYYIDLRLIEKYEE